MAVKYSSGNRTSTLKNTFIRSAVGEPFWGKLIQRDTDKDIFTRPPNRLKCIFTFVPEAKTVRELEKLRLKKIFKNHKDRTGVFSQHKMNINGI